VGKSSFAYHRPVVPSPPSDDRVEFGDEGRLWRSALLPDDLLEPVQVALYRLVTRFDERLEARVAPVTARPVLTNPILSHMKAQKVEAHLAFMFVQRVGDARLARFQVQANFRQPFLCAVAQREQRCQVRVQDDEIVGVPDERRRVGRGHAAGDGCLKTMQSDVTQQGRQYAPYNGSPALYVIELVSKA
jgi:hypothetical protein